MVRQFAVDFDFEGKKRFFIADFYCHELRLIIEIDGNWIKEILETQEVRLGHIVNIKMALRKHSYDKPNIYEEARLFGVSPIIV